MSVARGTTPTFTLDFSLWDVDFTQAENVYVTFSGRRTLTKTGAELEIATKQISVYLSQAETLAFKEGEQISIQANWTFAGGRRCSSEVVPFVFSRQLLDKVVV